MKNCNILGAVSAPAKVNGDVGRVGDEATWGKEGRCEGGCWRIVMMHA